MNASFEIASMNFSFYCAVINNLEITKFCVFSERQSD